ncbi:MAG TPA: hypothetical protein VEW27_15155 [Methylomirabilota bacterium]|nr:hypothetical protein [Methylomirabilota bacterium]
MVLSRSQEERVLAVLQRQLPGSLPLGYCVAHLATAAKVKPEQHVHLARFLYAVVRKGQCETLEEGLCTAGGHEVHEMVVRGRSLAPAERPR